VKLSPLTPNDLNRRRAEGFNSGVKGLNGNNWSIAKWIEGLSYRLSITIRRHTYIHTHTHTHIYIYIKWSSLIIWLFRLSIFSPCSSGSILYHCIYGFMLYASVKCVNYVKLLLCYVFSWLCIFRSRYSVSLCCSVYSLFVKTYCTTTTGCQPNSSKQIYHISILSIFAKIKH
jgi:hypothetical protein